MIRRVLGGRAVVAALAAGVLVLAGCGGAERADPEWVEELRADRDSDVTVGPATTAAPPDEAARGAEPPPLRTTGEDFDRIWREIEAFESWLLRHPERVDLLDEIYVPGGPIHTKTAELLADLQARDAVMEVAGYDILEVRLLDRSEPDVAHVRYTDTRSHRSFLDRATGDVIDREEFTDQPWTWDLTLERDDRGRWRITDIVFVGGGG